MLEGAVSRIADLTWKHPKLVLAAVGIFTLLAFTLSKDVQQHLKAAGFSDPASESARSQELLIEKTGSDVMPGIVVRITPPPGESRLHLRSPALREETRRIAAQLLSIEGIARVEDPLAGGSRQLIASDRSSMLLDAYFLDNDAEGLTGPAEGASERGRSARAGGV